VTWYKAAAYCNWLSEQEGIDEDQWCYLPVGEKYAEGMKLAPNHLGRTGYRLPTESEWEYSCRALASASRYFGQSEALLEKYVWYRDMSNDRSWPVAGLKPNDWGLFDTYGNVVEWCEDRYLSYSSTQDGKPTEDLEDTQAVQDRTSRVLRGGSFFNRALYLRSAYRFTDLPACRDLAFGFRGARTYH